MPMAAPHACTGRSPGCLRSAPHGERWCAPCKAANKPCHDRRVDEGDFGRPARNAPAGTPQGEGGGPSLGGSAAGPASPSRARNGGFPIGGVVRRGGQKGPR
jgi:hypothetical protein